MGKLVDEIYENAPSLRDSPRSDGNDDDVKPTIDNVNEETTDVDISSCPADSSPSCLTEAPNEHSKDQQAPDSSADAQKHAQEPEGTGEKGEWARGSLESVSASSMDPSSFREAPRDPLSIGAKDAASINSDAVGTNPSVEDLTKKLAEAELAPKDEESPKDAPKFNFGEKKKKKVVDNAAVTMTRNEVSKDVTQELDCLLFWGTSRASNDTKSSKVEIIDGTGKVFIKGHVYPYDELLARIQSLINANNPDLSGSKRYTIKPPQVVRVGSKKVAWINFKDICAIMGRSMDHVHQFVVAELGTEGSIAGDGQLVLKGKYGPKNIESLLRKYITEYVTCSMCKSPNTTMERDCRARLFTQHCEACGANRSVNPIKNGFHALGRGERRKAKI